MKHVSDFPADTKWVQTKQGAVAVVELPEAPWYSVYWMDKNGVVELKPENSNGVAGKQ